MPPRSTCATADLDLHLFPTYSRPAPAPTLDLLWPLTTPHLSFFMSCYIECLANRPCQAPPLLYGLTHSWHHRTDRSTLCYNSSGLFQRAAAPSSLPVAASLPATVGDQTAHVGSILTLTSHPYLSPSPRTLTFASPSPPRRPAVLLRRLHFRRTRMRL